MKVEFTLNPTVRQKPAGLCRNRSVMLCFPLQTLCCVGVRWRVTHDWQLQHNADGAKPGLTSASGQDWKVGKGRVDDRRSCTTGCPLKNERETLIPGRRSPFFPPNGC